MPCFSLFRESNVSVAWIAWVSIHFGVTRTAMSVDEGEDEGEDAVVVAEVVAAVAAVARA